MTTNQPKATAETTDQAGRRADWLGVIVVVALALFWLPRLLVLLGADKGEATTQIEKEW